MTYAVVGHAGEIAVGRRGFSRGSHRPLAVASCRHRAVYEQKKVPVLRLPPQISRGAAAGVRSNTFIVPPYSRAQGISQPAAGLSSCAGRTQAQTSRADVAPRISQRFADRVLLTNPSSLLRVPKPVLPEKPGPARRQLRRGPGTSKTRPPPARIAWVGNYRLRRKRG